MTLPDRLVIGAHTYTLDVTEDARRHLADEQRKGESYPDRASIRISNDLDASVQAETVVHEALHCMWAQTALPATEADRHEEMVVTALAPLIYDLLRQNPVLVAHLVDAPDGSTP